MPTLVRLLTVLSVIVAAAFATMLALATLVEPQRRTIVVDVPLDRLKTPAVAGAAPPSPPAPSRP